MNISPQNMKLFVHTMVRRVIRDGRAKSGLAHDILSIAKQEMMAGAMREQESLVNIVTDRVCRLLRAKEEGSTIGSGGLIATRRFAASSVGSSC